MTVKSNPYPWRERELKREWNARGGLEAPQGGTPPHATTSGGCPQFLIFFNKIIKEVFF
jgi:hypothetical protein